MFRLNLYVNKWITQEYFTSNLILYFHFSFAKILEKVRLFLKKNVAKVSLWITSCDWWFYRKKNRSKIRFSNEEIEKSKHIEKRTIFFIRTAPLITVFQLQKINQNGSWDYFHKICGVLFQLFIYRKFDIHRTKFQGQFNYLMKTKFVEISNFLGNWHYNDHRRWNCAHKSRWLSRFHW